MSSESLSLVSTARKMEISHQSSPHVKRDLRKNHNFHRLRKVFNHFDEISSFELARIRKRFGEGFLDNIPTGYKISRQLGKGKYGVTFLICKNAFDSLAVKVQEVKPKKEEAVFREVQLQRKFAEHGLAPEVHSDKPVFYMHQKKKYAVVIMDRIQGVLTDFLKFNINSSAIEELIDNFFIIIGTMREYGMAHGDLHDQNIGFDYRVNSRGKLCLVLTLIDFGFACLETSDTYLDTIQLLRTLHPVFDKRGERNKNVINRFTETLQDFIRLNYNNTSNLDDDDELDRLQEDAFYLYLDTCKNLQDR